jgi:hypothetical protein
MTLVQLSIPQPCSESWAAMTPTTAGRHCASCAKTVIDFTGLSDAEILAQLARAGRGGTCGRFRAGQLARSLQPLALAPARGWRAWLAAAVAVWGLREIGSVGAQAQAPTEQRTADAAQLPQQLGLKHKDNYEGLARPLLLQGNVLDASTQEGLPGVAVVLKGTTTGTATNYEGAFSLMLPADYHLGEEVVVEVRCLGYVTQEHRLAAAQLGQPLRFAMEVEVKGFMGEVVVTSLYYRPLPPAPWHPRRLYYWGKYWLTRPFRSY